MRLPGQKDIIIVDAEPHSGREYDGHSVSDGNVRRHMLVMSSSSYTRATGMVLAMPITTSERYANNPRYLPILVAGGRRDGVKGFVALWQLQNFDFVSRHGKVVNQVTGKFYKELVPYVKDMLGL